ncbi:HalOD1 output domain-containing protein [Natronococcus sp.]|uniref:HalOD1 output domain-containing protein n=1 Tax=Natronococcus sp. TaxID=35747 RepID=UPI0025E80E51|nr:HalOD1 output domain-containing protein [Natronococcus sp.]
MTAPSDPSAADGADRPTRAIIEAVARHEGVDVTAVEPPAYEPLYAVVDPEALDALFRGSSSDGASLSFEYAGYDVTVSGEGQIDVTDPSTGETVVGCFRE